MKIVLEIHRFAPELNKAYIGKAQTMLKVPGCDSIAGARKALFSQLPRKGRYVVMEARYPERYKHHNRTVAGFYKNTAELARHIKMFKLTHNLEGCEFVIKTRLIG